jgi:hypothetical protein
MANSPASNGLLVIERILRNRDGIWAQIIEERELRPLTLQMLASSVISLALYGAVLGASHSWQQALSSFVKLPLLFLATLAICLPTLYLFNLVFGARLSMVQAVALIMVSITVTSVLTLAFAPISLFFLITAQSYAFFKLLNVTILVLTAIVGLRFLIVGMRALNTQRETEAVASGTTPVPMAPPVPAPALVAPPQPVPPNGLAMEVGGAPVAVATLPVPGPMPPYPMPLPRPMPVRQPAGERPASMGLLYIWIVLFGFVGTQLAWTLRPFFGSPDQPFALFRHISGTFYADIFRTIGHLLGG